MSTPKFLITGATGVTGRETVRLLREESLPVRALVHREDARADALRALGAEVVVGDLHQLDEVRRALEGVQRAYFCYPVRAGIIDTTAYFAQAALEVKLEAIVNMSQISARRDANSHAAQDHWVAERILDRSGIPVTHLRPTLFAEWVLYWAKAIQAGTLRLPFGTGRHAPVTGADQARVIANVLRAPEAHAGKVYPLYGPKEMTFAEIASEVGTVLHRDVAYVQTAVPELKKIAPSVGMDLPDFFWQHVTEIAIDHQNGVFEGTNDIVERIGGRTPTSFTDFVASRRAAFGA